MAAGVLELLQPKPGQYILDVGCGTGHLTAEIASSGAYVTGTDRSPEMIRKARESYPDLRFEVMDARALEFSAQFDSVFSNATLHWIQEPEKVARRISAVLKPGGKFVAEFGGKRNVAGFMQAAERAWTASGSPGVMPNPWYYPSIAEYSQLLETHSLEVTYATLFERPTPLEDGERGLRNWINMFGESVVGALPPEKREQFIAEVEREARPVLYRDGGWIMDYRRLRVVAYKA